MMQHVATAKSEVAAFATSTQPSSFADSESNEQFGRLLQDQKPNKLLDVNPESKPAQLTSKIASQSPTEKIDNDTSSVVDEDTATQNDSTLFEPIKANDVQITTIAQDKTVTENSAGSSENVEINIAEEWVLLIENLNRLAEVDQTASPELIDQKTANDPVVITKKKAEQTIYSLVDKAISEILTTSEVEGNTVVDVPQKAAELLLEKPQIFEELISQLHIISQKNGIDISEKNVLEDVTKKNLLATNQLVDTEQQVDLTSLENKDLFRVLIGEGGTETETDSRIEVEIESGIDAEKTNTTVPVKLAVVDLPNATEKLTQLQSTEVGITKLGSAVDNSELLTQEVQIAQVVEAEPNKRHKENNAEKTANSDIKNILNLSESKLNKVLENIAQRVFDNKSANETIGSEQLVQQVVTPKTAEIISTIESSSKDFISTLKAGLEEFKKQLAQGREPGIDLKALVSEALTKTTDTSTVVKTSANLEQIVSSVSQVLDLAQSMSRTIENRHDQTYAANMREVAQIQGEQSKQIQLNQLESKFEKAINIAKPEGHQQLAEKVRWMVNTKNLVAEIRLDPAELGSVHVKVAMSGETATVNFVVQSQQARDAVDTATPRLREMLAEKGIELGQSSVRQDSENQQEQGDGELAKQGKGGNGDFEDADVPEQVLAQQNIVNGALGGIDYFV